MRGRNHDAPASEDFEVEQAKLRSRELFRAAYCQSRYEKFLRLLAAQALDKSEAYAAWVLQRFHPTVPATKTELAAREQELARVFFVAYHVMLILLWPDNKLIELKSEDFLEAQWVVLRKRSPSADKRQFFLQVLATTHATNDAFRKNPNLPLFLVPPPSSHSSTVCARAGVDVRAWREAQGLYVGSSRNCRVTRESLIKALAQ